MNIFQVETWLRLVIKLSNTVQQYMKAFRLLTLFHLGFLRMAQLGGGGGRKLPAAHNSKTINDNGIKFGGVVENHKLINFILFNWPMTS